MSQASYQFSVARVIVSEFVWYVCKCAAQPQVFELCAIHTSAASVGQSNIKIMLR